MRAGSLWAHQGTGQATTSWHPSLLDTALTRWRERTDEVAGHATGILERIELTAELGHGVRRRTVQLGANERREQYGHPGGTDDDQDQLAHG
jgi:hypothetical protein